MASSIISGNDFCWALDNLRAGFRVRRGRWNGVGMWIALQEPDANSKMDQPYIYICTAAKGYVPWVASQTDLLSTDWEKA